MPLTPKDILKTAIEQGRRLVGAGAGLGGRLRREEEDAEVVPTPSGSRAGGARTGVATPGTTRTARASGTGARKPAARPKPTGGPRSRPAASGDGVEEATKS